MKFKEGDRIRVKSAEEIKRIGSRVDGWGDDAVEIDGLFWNPKMYKFCGMESHISKITGDRYLIHGMVKDGMVKEHCPDIGNFWRFSSGMLQLVNSTEEQLKQTLEMTEEFTEEIL